MAPEVFRGEKYGGSVDTYALGIVMYTLLNQNRGPFLPAYPQPILPEDREAALQRRMSGEPIPALPSEGHQFSVNPQLNTLVLKACAYDRCQRYLNPTEMCKALERVAVNRVSELNINLSTTTPPLSTGIRAKLAPGADGQTLHLLSPETDQPIYIPSVSELDAPLPPDYCTHHEPNTPKPPLSSSEIASHASANPITLSKYKRPVLAAIIVTLTLIGSIGLYFGIGALNSISYGISIDGQTDIILVDKKEAQAVLNDLISYYIHLTNVDAKSVSFSYEEKVEIVRVYKPQEIQIMYRQDVLQALIDGKTLTTTDLTFTQPYLHVILKWASEITEEFDYKIEMVEDETLALNTTETQREGEKGVKNITYSYVSINGSIVEKTLLDEKSVKEPVNEIILVGIKPLETGPSGMVERAIASAKANKEYGISGDYSLNYMIQTTFPAKRIEFLFDGSDDVFYLESTVQGNITGHNIGTNNYVSSDNMSWQCNNEVLFRPGNRTITVTAFDANGNGTKPAQFTIAIYSDIVIVSALPNKNQGRPNDYFDYTIKANFPISKLEFQYSGNPNTFTVYANGTSDIGTKISISSDRMIWQIYNDYLYATGIRTIVVTAYDAKGNRTEPKSFNITISS
jgi:hypothetical protein